MGEKHLELELNKAYSGKRVILFLGEKKLGIRVE